MNRRIALIIVGVFAIGALAGFFGVRLLWWQPRPLSPNSTLVRELSLSNKQQERIAALNEPFFKHVALLRQEVNSKANELRQVLIQPLPDRVAVNDRLNEVIRLQNQLQRETVHHMLKVREELSEQQWAKFLALLERTSPAMLGQPRPERRRALPQRQ